MQQTICPQIKDKFHSLGSRGHERSKRLFLAKQFFVNNISPNKDRETILTPSCFSHQGALKYIHGDLVTSALKFDLRSRSFGDPGRLSCICGDAARRDEHIGVIRSSLSLLYQ